MVLVEYPHFLLTMEQMEMFSVRHSCMCIIYRGNIHISGLIAAAYNAPCQLLGKFDLLFIWALSERSAGRKFPNSCKMSLILLVENLQML